MKSVKRVLFLTPSVVGREMSAVGMRHFELARALSTHHEVTLAVSRLEGEPPPGVKVVPIGTEAELSRLAKLCDVLIVQGDLLRRYPGFQPPDVPLVVDMAFPTLLEGLERPLNRNGNERGADSHRDMIEYEGFLSTVNHLLRIGDFFLCASERQRDLVLGMLLTLNRLNPRTHRDDPSFDGLVVVVPNGVPDEEPRSGEKGLREGVKGIRPRDTLLYWGGGIWPWLDPVILVEAMAEIRKQRSDIKLFFAGTDHPSPDRSLAETARRTRQKAREAGLEGNCIYFANWVPYQERGSFLLDADIGVSAHRATVETRFALRMRVMDYLWAGLPIITTEGDETARLVREERIGEVVAPGDVKGWVSAILRLAGSTRMRRSYGDRSRQVGFGYRWSRVVSPLADFCRSPARAGDHRGVANRRGLLGEKIRRYGRRTLQLVAEGKFRDLLRGVRWKIRSRDW
ncbi:MAG: glycosyltransferase family 4 protein [Planctomycetota bacterium]|nr:glycosyltransferase family 4 protein [Planctomycetota bacterium]